MGDRGMPPLETFHRTNRRATKSHQRLPLLKRDERAGGSGAGVCLM